MDYNTISVDKVITSRTLSAPCAHITISCQYWITDCIQESKKICANENVQEKINLGHWYVEVDKYVNIFYM